MDWGDVEKVEEESEDPPAHEFDILHTVPEQLGLVNTEERHQWCTAVPGPEDIVARWAFALLYNEHGQTLERDRNQDYIGPMLVEDTVASLMEEMFDNWSGCAHEPGPYEQDLRARSEYMTPREATPKKDATTRAARRSPLQK